MASTATNSTYQNSRTPTEEHTARERAFNGPAANDPQYSHTQIPQKPVVAANDDAFMSPKWVDVDKNLKTQQAGSGGVLGNSTKTPAAVAPVAGGAGYNVGYRAGQKVAETRAGIGQKVEAVRQMPQRAAYRAGQKVAETRQKIVAAPAMIAKKRLEISRNVGVGVVGTRSELRRTTGRPLAKPRLQLNGSRADATDGQKIWGDAKKMVLKGGAVLFWLVAGIAVVADIVDLFTTLLNAAGVGLTATAIGAPFGIPLIMFSEVIDNVAALFINFTIVAYFSYIGGGFALRLVIMSIGAIMDAIPVLEILPITTAAFFAAYLFGRVIKKVVQVAESKLGRTVGGAVKLGKRVLKYI